ncbi:hypothetical protein QQZ08_009749 [Neonectria magnoliae]|uniref:Uncharacterized protein n=1 Tax=Neonectria magnoliae TaxID=2732573 RepID=A0ABR1HL75_9HYPO
MAILDAEEAINDDAFGYPLPSARGLDSDGNETPLVYSQENVFIRHLKTLEILDRLIDEFQLKTFVPNKLDSFWILGKRIREHSEEERRLAKEYTKTVKRYSKQLACLAGLSADDRGSVISRYSSIETLLQSLSRVVSHLVAADLMNEAEGSSIDDGEGEDRDSDEDYMEEKLPNSPSVAADGPDNGGRMDLGENSPRESPGEDPVQQAPRPVETEKEHQDKSTGRNKQAPSIDTIDDMLVWRCILLSMLFQTAPDNTELLRSGLWTHVDPII